MISLSLSTLSELPRTIQRPRYQPNQLTPGIVHIGVGNFHRAHQALYLDDLFNQGKALDWAIVGAGVRPGDHQMRNALEQQDWLYTVVEVEAEEKQARINGAMTGFVPVESKNQSLIQQMIRPEIRIVSLTVTEGGYCINPATGRFDPEHPEIRADVQNPTQPQSVFGVLLRSLHLRREAGLPPFTVMSCDNLPGNGEVTRNAVLGLARLQNPELAQWVEQEVAFPNGMVDRITPATSSLERQTLAQHYGVQDNWPVFCEPFRQWVLQDHFPQGRPPFEEVGVTFTEHVEAFEFMKIRILNGGHAAIAYPAALLSLHQVDEAMRHPLIQGFLRKLEEEEIIPIVPPVPDTDLKAYYQLIEKRFSNPEVKDTIPRLCQDGSNRQPKFILPSTRDRLQQGLKVPGLALVSALWCRYCAGTTESGSVIHLDDPNAAVLAEAALAAKERPQAFLELKSIFGELAEAPDFVEAFSSALKSIWTDGTAATLERYIQS